jgi:hypothetical protein
MLFYGDKNEGQWISEVGSGLDGGIKEIYVDDYTYQTQKGELFPDNFGLCNPLKGQMILNRGNLNKEISNFEKKYADMPSEKKGLYLDLYKKIMHLTKDKWASTFYHEVFHQLDHDLSPDGKKNLSETKNSPFLKKESHNITSHTGQTALTTAAETFKELLMKKIKMNISMDDPNFILYLKASEFWEEYEFIVKNYLKKK